MTVMMILGLIAFIAMVVFIVYMDRKNKKKFEELKQRFRITYTNTPRFPLFKIQFIIAICTTSIQGLLWVLSYVLCGHSSNSSIMWTVLWGGWAVFCYYKWKIEKN